MMNRRRYEQKRSDEKKEVGKNSENGGFPKKIVKGSE
jgi:hypothetical protein